MSTLAAIHLHLRANPELFLLLCMPWLSAGKPQPMFRKGEPQDFSGLMTEWPDYRIPWIALCCWTGISQIPRRGPSRQGTVWPSVCVWEAWDKLFLASVSPYVSNISLNRDLTFRQLKLEKVKPTLTDCVRSVAHWKHERNKFEICDSAKVLFVLPVTHLWVSRGWMVLLWKWAV